MSSLDRTTRRDLAPSVSDDLISGHTDSCSPGVYSSEGFEDLGVAEDFVAVLADAGISRPFPIQSLTIPDALQGRDVAGKAKTGSGKTLAFGIPVLERVERARQRFPRGLVLVPTRELASQVTASLAPLAEVRGLTLEAFYGGVPLGPQIAASRRGVDVVVATPGRLIDLIERRALSVVEVEVITLDEADRMADMGFLPQVQRILRQIEGHHQTLLFSATLDSAVDTLVKGYMIDPVFHEIRSGTETVDEMKHRFVTVKPAEKTRVAAVICHSSPRTLIFVKTKQRCEILVRELHREGVRAVPIHGDLPQEKRERALESFVEGTIPVLVATDIAARGIHVDAIDVVIQYDPPDDHKSYLHRSGRTARAGEAGLAITIVQWNEQHEVRRLQRRLGIDHAIVEMDASDPRLRDLGAWDPPKSKPLSKRGPFSGRDPGFGGKRRRRGSLR